MKYSIINTKSEITIESSAKTLIGAKREATRQASFGGGSLVIVDQEGNVLSTSKLEEDFGKFYWTKWED